MIKHTFSIASLLIITPMINGSPQSVLEQSLAQLAASSLSAAGHVASGVGSAMHGIAGALPAELDSMEEELSTMDPKMFLNALIVLTAWESCKMGYRLVMRSEDDISEVTHESVDQKIAAAQKSHDKALQTKLEGIREVLMNSVNAQGKRQDKIEKRLDAVANDNKKGLAAITELVLGDGTDKEMGILKRHEAHANRLKALESHSAAVNTRLDSMQNKSGTDARFTHVEGRVASLEKFASTTGFKPQDKKSRLLGVFYKKDSGSSSQGDNNNNNKGDHHSTEAYDGDNDNDRL